MARLNAGLILGAALAIVSVAPALAQSAQSGRYATDPDPFIYSQLPYEHRALNYPDAMLPRTALPRRSPLSARGQWRGTTTRPGWSAYDTNEVARFDPAKGVIY